MKHFTVVLIALMTWICLPSFALDFNEIQDHQIGQILNDYCLRGVQASSSLKDYLEGRLSQNDKRYDSTLHALNLLSSRKAKVLVETGTARNGDKNFSGDGGSTIIYAHWAYEHDAVLYSVDIDPEATHMAKKYTTHYAPNVHIVCSDSIKFLTDFKKRIDFLYLDSFDYDINNPNPSQEHHLKELIAAYPKLHHDSIIMIDDCDLPNGGKGKLVIQYLLSHHWKIVRHGYQVILVRC